MKIKIGNSEAIYLRQRIAKIGVTQKQLAERINVSERYIRDILSTQKDKEIQVDREKIEEILALLGVGLNQIFKHKQTTLNLHPQLDLYIKTLKTKMYSLIVKNRLNPSEYQNLSNYLDEDKAINKTMGFWYTLIVKTIGDKYQVMRDFFDKNDFFTIIPTEGYWRIV